MIAFSSKRKKSLDGRQAQINFRSPTSDQCVLTAPLHHSGDFYEDAPLNVFTACLMPEHGAHRQYVAKGWEGEQWDESYRVLFGYGAVLDAPHSAEYEVLMLEICNDLTDGCYEIDSNGLVSFEYGLMYTVANYMKIFKAVGGSVTFKFDRVRDVVEATFRDVLIRIEPYGNSGEGPNEGYDLVLAGELRVYRGFYGERPYPSGVHIPM